MSHVFHIPVLGLAFSIDTPVKVARYGISSVVSIVDDILIERMREYYSRKIGEEFVPINKQEPDFRARRITAYLNLLQQIVRSQFKNLRESDFVEGTEITKYFELLPDHSELKQQYLQMLLMTDAREKAAIQKILKSKIRCGEIDVNIMSKVDKVNYETNGKSLGDQFTDAVAAVRGFAQSDLESSIILSAGMNPRLYSSLETYPDFYPDKQGRLKKRIILKVSDFRSALIQAKFLAKKGLWVSEFRIESGLNCGGHAFATEGLLLGPILEEFKQKRTELLYTVFDMYQSSLKAKGLYVSAIPEMRVTVQGGIGTAEENSFLLEHFKLDGTGWGSPFLLVPEATNVDETTLDKLIIAEQSDFYISGSSPLGVPFNNFRGSSAELLRLERIKKGRPGSPCKKKYLVSNTEFTDKPICTASREYQSLKLKELDKQESLSSAAYKKEFDRITEKVCLCEGLATSVYIKNGLLKPREERAVSICPGPNIAYFSGKYSLQEMVNHIYGKGSLLKSVNRPNIFVNELKLYVEYLQKDIQQHITQLSDKKDKYFARFRSQLQEGIEYYKSLIPFISNETETYKKRMLLDIQQLERNLAELI